MTDQDTTQRMPAADPPEPERPRRLLRSRSERMLGGVAGGLGNYFSVDPVIFRIAFGVTAIFGGIGIALYLALIIFVPSDTADGTGQPKPRTFGRIALGIVVAIAALVGLFVLAAGAAWAGATGHGVLIACTVILIGAALAAAAFRGGARWLILPALALAIPLGTVAAADIEFEGAVGESTHRPQSVKAIPPAGYEHGIGKKVIDLREIDWTGQDVVKVKAEQGIGHLVIAVPEDVCVDANADTDYGVVALAGDETSEVLAAGYGATPRLELDAHLDVGKIEIVNDDDADLDRDRFGDRDDISRDELGDRMEDACATMNRAIKADEG